MSDVKSKLKASLERGKTFKSELKTCDPATAAQLIAAWKEFILEEMLGLFRMSNDVDWLHVIDNNIGAARDCAEDKRRGNAGELSMRAVLDSAAMGILRADEKR
jgi:hypothetical protein